MTQMPVLAKTKAWVVAVPKNVAHRKKNVVQNQTQYVQTPVMVKRLYSTPPKLDKLKRITPPWPHLHVGRSQNAAPVGIRALAQKSVVVEEVYLTETRLERLQIVVVPH